MHCCQLSLSAVFYIVCLLEVNEVFSQQPPEYNDRVFQECNTTIRQGDGVIISPNFTATYPNNLHCWWTIVVELDRIVTLTFGHFDIESGVNCQHDKVSVFDGPTADHPKLGKFCGPFRPGQQISSSNKLHLRMDTDSSTGRSGFYAAFLSATPALATEGSCGGLLTGTEGSFYSPNYPDSDYPPGVSCSWHIKTEENRVLRLSFKEFDIEQSNGCKYDSLVVYAGWTFSEKTKYIGRYCGGIDTLPSAIESPGNELYVTFISDASGVDRGFVADYVTEEREGAPRVEIPTTLPPTTELITTTSTSTTAHTTTSYDCPARCPSKAKLKVAICKATYVVAIKVIDARSLRRLGSTSVQIVKAFKLGPTHSSSEMNIRLMCPQCFKMSKAGSYLVAGSNAGPLGLIIQPGDLVVKFKDRKHTKQATKLLKRCKKKNLRKGRKRSAAKRKRESI